MNYQHPLINEIAKEYHLNDYEIEYDFQSNNYSCTFDIFYYSGVPHDASHDSFMAKYGNSISATWIRNTPKGQTISYKTLLDMDYKSNCRTKVLGLINTKQ